MEYMWANDINPIRFIKYVLSTTAGSPSLQSLSQARFPSAENCAHSQSYDPGGQQYGCSFYLLVGNRKMKPVGDSFTQCPAAELHLYRNLV